MANNPGSPGKPIYIGKRPKPRPDRPKPRPGDKLNPLPTVPGKKPKPMPAKPGGGLMKPLPVKPGAGNGKKMPLPIKPGKPKPGRDTKDIKPGERGQKIPAKPKQDRQKKLKTLEVQMKKAKTRKK